jgi:hypothetical protein
MVIIASLLKHLFEQLIDTPFRLLFHVVNGRAPCPIASRLSNVLCCVGYSIAT